MAVVHNLLNSTPSNPTAIVTTESVAIGATSITVSSDLTTRGLAAPFKATFVSSGEIVRVTAISGTTWAVTRASEGTAAAAYDVGAAIELRITAVHLTERNTYSVYPSSSATANTLAIRAAIAAGHLSFAPGTYNVARTGTETELFLITAALKVQGNGANIVLAGDTPNTVDVFRIVPSGEMMGLAITGLWVYPATTGAGRHAFHYDIPGYANGGGFVQGEMFDMRIGKSWLLFGGKAIQVTNPEDGFVRSSFTNSQVFGEVVVNKAGDSLLFDAFHVTTASAGYAFDIQGMIVGAGQLIIRGCNIIAKSGAINVTLNAASSWNSVKIADNDCDIDNTEDPSYGGACVVTGGREVTIRDNRFHITGNTHLSHGVYLDGVTRCAVTGNQLSAGSTGRDIMLSATCVDSYAPEASNYLATAKYTNSGSNRAAF
jgi:hypothetical protein